MKEVMEERIQRLTRMMGTDEGFYILALHSFVEYFLRYEKKYGEAPSFPELTWMFREELLNRYGEEFIEGLYCLGRLGQQHSYANKVRHAFERMDVEEARAATHLFLTFCKLAGIASMPALGHLQQHLELWRDHSSPLEKNTVIRHMQQELEKLRSENKSLLEQKKDYDEMKQQLRGMQRKLAGFDDQIHEREKISAHRDARLDELRTERRGLIDERNELLERLNRFDKLETYLRYLGRLSNYTRTRMDFEQTVSRLTPEQEEAISAVKLKGHFLIRGGPGTGKSLVLIESLRRAARQNELHFRDDEQALLVTFTRTLAKYNRYLSELRGMNIPLEVIDTIDRLFQEYLHRYLPDLQFDFAFLVTYLDEEKTPDFISSEELLAEIEEFIFALGLDRAEYIEGRVSRKGMRQRLSRGQRETVWNIALRAAEMMSRRGIYTKNFSRLVLLRFLEGENDIGENALIPVPLRPPGVSSPPVVRYLFLDEVQDLTPVALKILKKVTDGPMIMAGDTDQSLYVFYSPFSRGGIDLRGATRVLKTNFRNTRQIHDIAQRFRSSGKRRSDEEAPETTVFREGPDPELYTSRDAEELIRILTDKLSLFLDETGYDPENICILVPRRREIETIMEALEGARIPCEDLRSESFSFRSTGKVRLSTLHSSKGLDFPVVMLYLPALHRRHYYNSAETEKLLRNLLFVGMTRAMDNLNVFLLERDDPILKDLAGSFHS